MVETNQLRLRAWVVIVLGCLLAACESRPSSPPPSPSATAAKPTRRTPRVHTPKVQDPERPDAEVEYPEPVDAEVRIEGLVVRNWGYRLTAAGQPENVLIFQCRLANESTESKEALLVMGLEHAEPWYRDAPAWFRADFRVVRLQSGEEILSEASFPGMRNIHLGIKREVYVPKVRVIDPSIYRDPKGAKNRTGVFQWNWTVMKRPGGSRAAVFSGFLRSFDEKAKTAKLLVRLKVRSDVPETYDGKPEGYEETHEVALPEGKPYTQFTVFCPIAGIPPSSKATLFFAPAVEIVSVRAGP